MRIPHTLHDYSNVPFFKRLLMAWWLLRDKGWVLVWNTDLNQLEGMGLSKALRAETVRHAQMQAAIPTEPKSGALN